MNSDVGSTSESARRLPSSSTVVDASGDVWIPAVCGARHRASARTGDDWTAESLPRPPRQLAASPRRPRRLFSCSRVRGRPEGRRRQDTARVRTRPYLTASFSISDFPRPRCDQRRQAPGIVIADGVPGTPSRRACTPSHLASSEIGARVTNLDVKLLIRSGLLIRSQHENVRHRRR